MNIVVHTECDGDRTGLTEAELRTLIARIGRPDDQFVLVEREPADPDRYIQAWHQSGDAYEVEFRDGGRYTTELTSADEVADLFMAWINRAEDWRGIHDWQPVKPYPALPDEAMSFARTLVHGGFRSMGQIISDVLDYFGEDTIAFEQAAVIVVHLWRERGAEQQTWPDITDPDRLTSAFDQLNANGIVARQDFACCRNCGFSEIGDEADDDSRGFVFFHSQDTDRAADGEGLWLAFGAFPDAPDTTESIGNEVVAVLTDAGLPVTWNGDVDHRIEISPLVWNKRLPAK